MRCRRCDAELQPGRKLTLCAACRRNQDRGHDIDPYDRSRDNPASQCAHPGCHEVATWRDPVRGCGWRACDKHKLQGDDPITPLGSTSVRSSTPRAQHSESSHD